MLLVSNVAEDAAELRKEVAGRELDGTLEVGEVAAGWSSSREDVELPVSPPLLGLLMGDAVTAAV